MKVCNSENETHHEPDANSSAAATAALLFIPVGFSRTHWILEHGFIHR